MALTKENIIERFEKETNNDLHYSCDGTSCNCQKYIKDFLSTAYEEGVKWGRDTMDNSSKMIYQQGYKEGKDHGTQLGYQSGSERIYISRKK